MIAVRVIACGPFLCRMIWTPVRCGTKLRLAYRFFSGKLVASGRPLFWTRCSPGILCDHGRRTTRRRDLPTCNFKESNLKEKQSEYFQSFLGLIQTSRPVGNTGEKIMTGFLGLIAPGSVASAIPGKNITERDSVFRPVAVMRAGDWVSGFIGLVLLIGWLSQIFF